MAVRTGLNFRMRSCQRCGGDAYLDVAEDRDREWRCLQCGRVVVIQAEQQQPEAAKLQRAA